MCVQQPPPIAGANASLLPIFEDEPTLFSMIETPRAASKPLFEELIDAFPPDHAYARNAFERAPMPALVAHFLTHRLYDRLDFEVDRWRKNRSEAWFDYEHPNVRSAQQSLVSALAQQAQFPEAEWETALQQAVDYVTAYLVTPQKTLTDFVFEDVSALPVHLVDRRLSYFGAYTYLQEGVQLHFKRKRISNIDRDAFAELLYRIDRRKTEDYDGVAWRKLLEPFFDFMQRDVRLEGVPLPLLIAFFEDKETEVEVHRLKRATEDLEMITGYELETVLDAPEEPDEVEPDPIEEVVPSPVSESHFAQLPGQQPPVVKKTPEPPHADPTAPIPLWKQFQRGVQHPDPGGQTGLANRQGFARIPDQEGQRVPEEIRQDLPPPPTPSAPLWRRFQPALDTEGDPDLTTLERTVLGNTAPRNRKLFVAELFEGSREDYLHTLQRLHGAANWPQASKIIAEDIFRKHQVNIYSDPAILFTDAVEMNYRTR